MKGIINKKYNYKEYNFYCPCGHVTCLQTDINEKITEMICNKCFKKIKLKEEKNDHDFKHIM